MDQEPGKQGESFGPSPGPGPGYSLFFEIKTKIEIGNLLKSWIRIREEEEEGSYVPLARPASYAPVTVLPAADFSRVVYPSHEGQIKSLYFLVTRVFQI
jgi:hypothetical protein